MKPGPTRILVARTDRLGDVILATPVVRALKQLHPDAEIFFLVQQQWMPVLQYGDQVMLLAYDSKETFQDLAKRLKPYQFRRAYVLRDEKKVSQAVNRAGIPERVGPYSSLRSFFLFNRGKFQSRSRCRMHESEYNLELIHSVRRANDPRALPKPWVQTSDNAKRKAAHFLKSEGLKAKAFYVIHPGSSGSARYVKQASLHELARALLAKGKPVVVSGGPGEDELIDEFKKAVPEVKMLAKENAIGLDGMAEVYREALAVIAHGTGPLHLAAAVGTPVLAIFPPIFGLGEKRWGPLVQARAIWTPPEVKCPAVYRCIGEKCRYYDCMDRFEIKEALSLLESINQINHEA